MGGWVGTLSLGGCLFLVVDVWWIGKLVPVASVAPLAHRHTVWLLLQFKNRHTLLSL